MLQYIYQQPNPFEKFVYNSLVRKKTELKAEFVFCHHTVLNKVWLVVDLYRQLDPHLLSGHTLRKNDKRHEAFIADIMDQEDLSTSFYKYTLRNCHIRRTSNARQLSVIKEKLRQLKLWQRLSCDLTASVREWIDNTMALDYAKAKCEKKVYLGFSSYVYNQVTFCQEKLGETIFSHAIYDSSEFAMAASGTCSIAGGSTHVLKINDCLKVLPNSKVHLLLTDEEKSWQAETIGVVTNDGICFVAPPYSGSWHLNDGNCLIDVKVLRAQEGFTKSNFKFVYV